MDKLIIEGGQRLVGAVSISGAKNAALPILAATLLSDDKSIIRNVPALRDMSTMLKIIRNLGVKVEQDGDEVIVEPKGYKKWKAPYDLVSTMRASICVLGPLLAKQRFAEVSFPGGCIIGPRPIDLHMKGIKALGVKVKVEKGYRLEWNEPDEDKIIKILVDEHDFSEERVEKMLEKLAKKEKHQKGLSSFFKS